MAYELLILSITMNAKPKVQNITGLVVPSEWNDSGEPTEIKICTPGEVDYVIIEDKKGKRLYKFLHQFVKVSGVIKLKQPKNEIEIKSLHKENT